jgi:hypothetical protein
MYVLVALQLAALALFVVVAMGKAIDGEIATATDFSWSWLSPFSVASFSALATALSLSIFMYLPRRPGTARCRRARRRVGQTALRGSRPCSRWGSSR